MRKERIETPDNIPHAEPPFSDNEINCYGRGDCEMIGGGTVWYMCETADEVSIYKIGL